jgi:hypothetical protein
MTEFDMPEPHHVIDHFLKNHIKILEGDVTPKVGREDIIWE